MTCPNCHCPECKAWATREVSAILRKHVGHIDPVSRETDPDAEQLARAVVDEMARCG